MSTTTWITSPVKSNCSDSGKETGKEKYTAYGPAGLEQLKRQTTYWKAGFKVYKIDLSNTDAGLEWILEYGFPSFFWNAGVEFNLSDFTDRAVNNANKIYKIRQTYRPTGNGHLLPRLGQSINPQR